MTYKIMLNAMGNFGEEFDLSTFVREIKLPFVPHAGMKLSNVVYDNNKAYTIEEVIYDTETGYFDVWLEEEITLDDIMGEGIYSDWFEVEYNQRSVMESYIMGVYLEEAERWKKNAKQMES